MNSDVISYGVLKTVTLIGLAIPFSIGVATLAAFVMTIVASAPSMVRFSFLALRFCLASASLGIIGVVAGFLTGVSRVPAVAALIPGLLTFLGGFCVYLFASGRKTVDIATSAVSIVCFGAMLTFGAITGSLERELYEIRQSSAEKRIRDVDIEFQVRQYRKGLGLPLDGSVIDGKK